MTFNSILIIFFGTLILLIFLFGITKLTISLINNLPSFYKKLFNIKTFFLRKKLQIYFYTYEQFKEKVIIFGKEYIKLNNYLFQNPNGQIKIPKNLGRNIFQVIIVFYNKNTKYFNYLINKKEYTRVVNPKSFNFFKIKIPKNNNFKIKKNKNDLILKTFYIKKTKKKLVLMIMLDGLNNSLSNLLKHSNKFFQSSNKLESMWSNSPWTLPTFGNLLTGMYTSRHLNYKPISYYSSSLSKKNLSSFINPNLTLFEFFQKNNFITGCYSPYIRINPTYNFDRGVDIFKHCGEESADEIIDSIIAQLEMFNESSNFIFAHLFDAHHVVKGFNRIADYAKFPENNFNYKEEIEKENIKKKFNNKLERFLRVKNFYQQKETISSVQYCDLRLNYLYNYLSKNKFDDFTIMLVGDHGTRFKDTNITGNVLGKHHQNVGLFIKDKKIKSFSNKKNKFIETIDIFPSLISRYGKNNDIKLKKQFDGKNTIFSNTKKDYVIAENIYNKDFNLLINLNRNYLYSTYKMAKNTLVEKISTRFYNKKENLIKFSNNNLELKRLKSIEKKHIKNIKLDKIVKL